MIIECSTLEQIKEVVKINDINAGWCDYDMLQSLKHFGTICVKINDCHGFNFKEFYEENYKDIPIISYDEYIKSLNKLNLSISLKLQPDNRTVVYECQYIADELRGKGLLAKKDGYEIKSIICPSIDGYYNILYVRGGKIDEDYRVNSLLFESQEQAEKFIATMNELVEEINNPKTDWSKVEEGAEVKVNGYIAKFHSYVPKLNKVIVIFGENVNAVDEDKVELV